MFKRRNTLESRIASVEPCRRQLLNSLFDRLEPRPERLFPNRRYPSIQLVVLHGDLVVGLFDSTTQSGAARVYRHPANRVSVSAAYDDRTHDGDVWTGNHLELT